jgi:hypothetical protein
VSRAVPALRRRAPTPVTATRAAAAHARAGTATVEARHERTPSVGPHPSRSRRPRGAANPSPRLSRPRCGATGSWSGWSAGWCVCRVRWSG